jgi:hypothetical protein
MILDGSRRQHSFFGKNEGSALIRAVMPANVTVPQAVKTNAGFANPGITLQYLTMGQAIVDAPTCSPL